jgi:isopentenyldiphosphate isomerase
METLQLTLNFDKQQIINIFRQLKPIDRKSVFDEFKEDIYSYFYENDIEPMSIEEYNQKLEQSEKEFSEGKYVTNQELLKKVDQWSKEKK